MTLDDPCPELDALEEVLKLPATDSRRRHVDDCPRCHARALTFLEFTAEPDDVPADLLDDAEEALNQAWRRDVEASRPLPRGEARRPFPDWFDALIRPRTLAFAVAAVAVISVALQLSRVQHQAPPLLRGTEQHAAPNAAAPIAMHAVIAADGVSLSWSAVPGADAYEVRIYGTALDEIARLPATPDTHVTLTRGMLPESASSGAAALWKVVALKAGDPLQESQPAELRLP